MRKRTCPNLQIREKSFERNELFFLFVRVSIESKIQKKVIFEDSRINRALENWVMEESARM